MAILGTQDYLLLERAKLSLHSLHKLIVSECNLQSSILGWQLLPVCVGVLVPVVQALHFPVELYVAQSAIAVAQKSAFSDKIFAF